jgi:hypothetical protein
MKKIILTSLLVTVMIGFVSSQVPEDHDWWFTHNGHDTLLSREQIHFWGQTGQFPTYLDWKNSAFAISPSTIDGVGLFTNSQSSFTTGQDVGWAFIKVASTGHFMDDYYESNIGMFVNDSQTPNVEIVSSPQGLMMRAVSNIGPNTEIVARYKDIIDLFPGDNTVKFLIKYW